MPNFFRKLTLARLGFFILSYLLLPAHADTKPLTIMLDWELNPDHAPLFVASHYGFFAKEDLVVQWQVPADPADPPKFAAIGKIDAAITYEPQWLQQQRQGLPLVWVATLVGQPLTALMAQPNLASLKALQGQSVGYSLGGTSEVILQAMLHSAGLSTKDIKPINVHYDLLQAFAAKRVGAISGVMRNVEPIELKQKNIAYVLYYPEEYGVPSYAELILVTRTKLKNDPRFEALRRALTQAVEYLKTHPEETWQAFAKENPALNDHANHAIWLASIPYFYDRPGYFDQKQYETLQKFLKPQSDCL